MLVRLIIKSSLAVLGVTALGMAALAWYVGSKIVAPANHPVPLPQDFPAEQVSIPGNGHSIAGWWLEGGADSPVVLLLHGIRADRSSMAARARLLAERGFSVLLIDLQAHGETPGEAITFGLRESADVAAARDWMRQKAPGRRMGVIGQSMGGAAVLLGQQPSGFDAVVLEETYPRIKRALKNRAQMRLGLLAPALSPLLLMQLPLRLHIAPSDLEQIRSISRLGAPVLVVAGEKDAHTTLTESQELFDAAAQPKALWIVEGAHHQDFFVYDPQGYKAHVVAFLSEHLGVKN
jgi:fermentation-respiration switch protein FrsA (DUF1100 family)